MRQFNILRGTKGFLTARNRALRFAYMIKNKAKRRALILTFWEKHGLEATIDAFGVSRPTLYRWQKTLKDNQGRLESLNPKSTTPKRKRQRIVPNNIKDRIIEIRTEHCLGKDKVHRLLTNEGYNPDSASTIGRIIKELKQRGSIPTNQKVSLNGRTGRIHQRKPRKTRPKLRNKQKYRVLQLDTIVRYIDGTKRYILTAIDTKTRITFATVYTNHGSASAADFLKNTLTCIPEVPAAIQTDNGSEFAKHFRDTAKKLNLTHYHTYPRCPKMNAQIERFNRTLQEEWIQFNRHLIRDDVKEANHKLMDYLLWYNSKRPHHSLNLASPFQAMLESMTLSEMESQRWWTYTFP